MPRGAGTIRRGHRPVKRVSCRRAVGKTTGCTVTCHRRNAASWDEAHQPPGAAAATRPGQPGQETAGWLVRTRECRQPRLRFGSVASQNSTNAQRALADFLVYLGVELQVSPHTVAAYRSDLSQLLSGRTDLPDRAVIDRHLARLATAHAPASVARGAPGIRGFSRFLQVEGLVSGDVTSGLLGPKLERRLPKALSRKSM